MNSADIAGVVEQLIKAENAADARAAGQYLAADFTTITRARGVEQDRAALLEELAHPAKQLVRELEGTAHVLHSGDLAVVQSVVRVYQGSPAVLSGRFRNTHVLRMQDGAWKCAAWQVTKLA